MNDVGSEFGFPALIQVNVPPVAARKTAANGRIALAAQTDDRGSP
jgi:hypothetical protein